jgi:hypothetical protein
MELGDRYEAGRGAPGSDRPPGRGPGLWIVLVLVAVAAAAAWWLLSRGPGDESGQPRPVADARPPVPSAAEVEAPEEDLALPPLDASDAVVARLAGALSGRPELARYLATDGLIRRFVAAVDNVSRGVSPRTNLPTLIPAGGYRVTGGAGEAVRPDPESRSRYDAPTAVLASIDTAGAARLHRRLRPLLEEAYRDLGYPEGGFDATLARAIDHLLAAPVPPADPELVPAGRGGGWAYADPALEDLSPAQKHLLRAGPDNVRRIQAKLRELRGALDLDAG